MLNNPTTYLPCCNFALYLINFLCVYNVKHMLLSLDARHFGEFFTVGLIHFARGDGPSGDPAGPSGNPTGSSGDPIGPSGDPTRPFVTLFSYQSALVDWASIITFLGYYY